MGTYRFNNSAGQTIAYSLDFDSSGVPIFEWSESNRNNTCIMYIPGQLDQTGINNFSRSVAGALRMEQETSLPPGLPRTPDMLIDGWAASATAPGRVLDRYCGWSQNVDPNTGLRITLSSLDDGAASRAEATNSIGGLVATREDFGNGGYVDTRFDPTNAQLWDKQVSEFGPGDQPIGVIRDYGNVFHHYLAFHDFPAAQLSQFDWTSALDFSAAAERAAFDYVGTNDGTPSFFSYETNYSATYDFSASTFNVSSNGNVTRVDSGLGFDISGGSGQPVNFAVGITTPTDLFDFSFDWLDSLF